jgi:type II secretory pathway component GspD/PulD (secretin)
VRPTRAQLYVQPVRTYTIVGAAANRNSTATIEMPEITIHRVRTNAVIPDGGSIILGGMNAYWKQHTRQGIPFLSHIPFLGRLFGRDVTSDQKQTLLIMITCYITLFQELEAEL